MSEGLRQYSVQVILYCICDYSILYTGPVMAVPRTVYLYGFLTVHSNLTVRTSNTVQYSSTVQVRYTSTVRYSYVPVRTRTVRFITGEYSTGNLIVRLTVGTSTYCLHTRVLPVPEHGTTVRLRTYYSSTVKVTYCTCTVRIITESTRTYSTSRLRYSYVQVQ